MRCQVAEKHVGPGCREAGTTPGAGLPRPARSSAPAASYSRSPRAGHALSSWFWQRHIFFFPLAKFVVAKVSFIGLPCGPAVTGIHRWARCVQERGSG